MYKNTMPSRLFPSKILCWFALLLWVVGAGVLGWFFMTGITAPGDDGRTAIQLKEAEHAFILKEMRQLLQSVDGVIRGLSDPDTSQGRTQAATAARSGGMGMAADANLALMLKLPLPFKQMGLSVHKDFDRLADAITEGITSQQMLSQLSSITSRCTACHEMFQLTAS
ncbi:MAG: hypothetical protein WD425_00265 [Nitrospirales bacterium]